MQLHLMSVFLLVAGFQYSDACSCAPAHIQSHFCESDYVMKVRVRSMEKVHSRVKSVVTENNETATRINGRVTDIKYQVDIMRMYKLEANSAGLRKNSTVAVLYTAADSAMCGVHLNLKNKYLIGGIFRGPQTSVNICGLVTPWPWVSKRQRKNLLSMYAENCDCKIENWYENVSSENKCKLTRNGKLKKCYERDTACIHDKNSITGGCKWHRNKHMRACKAAARKPQLP